MGKSVSQPKLDTLNKKLDKKEIIKKIEIKSMGKSISQPKIEIVSKSIIKSDSVSDKKRS